MSPVQDHAISHSYLESPFDDEQRKEIIRNVIEPMVSDGLRTIGLAYNNYIQSGKVAAVNDVISIFFLDESNA
ncbi:Plasma membrane calcium-transporting ATPase [Dirofilaria immitis]